MKTAFSASIAAALLFCQTVRADEPKAEGTEGNPKQLQASGNAADEDKVPRKSITVTAAKLIEAYDRDEKAADALYLGETLKVTGAVGRMWKSDDGHVCLDLKANAKPTRGVQCQFDFPGERRLGSVQAGGTLTVIGRCDGKHDAVILKQCEVAK